MQVKKEKISMPKPFADYFEIQGVATLLFTLAGLIASGYFLTYAASGGQSSQGLLQGIILKNSVFGWFCAVVLAFAALVCGSLANFSAKASHKTTWRIFCAFFALLSCQEAASMKDFTGWMYFSRFELETAPWVTAIALILPFVVLGYRLRDALRESAKSAGCLALGAVLYAAASVAQALTIGDAYAAREHQLWPLVLMGSAVVKMLGASLLFLGFLFHERFLSGQWQRFEKDLTPVTIPTPESEVADWALRMIGTPTRDEILMDDEVRRRAGDRADDHPERKRRVRTEWGKV